MNIDEVRDFIGKQSWIFAKTYADKAPHEYIVRHKHAGTDDEMMAFARYIEENGQTIWFWRRPNKYIYVDGMYYWTMSIAMNDDGELKCNYNDNGMVINRSYAKDYFVSISWKGLPK